MFIGAPMLPVVLATGTAVMLAMLGLFTSVSISIAVITAYVPVYAWMRAMTRSDDQRLNQLVLRLRLRARMQGARRFWGAFTFVPLTFKKR